jgi:hypothetical protein
MGKLTDTKVLKAQKKDNPYKLSDGGGLFLFVTNTGSKLWRWQYRFNGVPKLMALGTYPDLSLEQVRKLHTALRSNLAGGVDPMETRKAQKGSFAQTTKAPVTITTVRVVTDDKGKKVVKIAPVANSLAWVEQQWFEQWKADKSPRHAQQVENRIATDILPKLGHRPIAEIEAPEIADVALDIEARGGG